MSGAFQPSLFDAPAPSFDREFASLEHPPRRSILARLRAGAAAEPRGRFSSGEAISSSREARRSGEWEHSVPKVAHAGPRISLAFRYGMQGGVYAPPSGA